jgi:hypothetical protein
MARLVIGALVAATCAAAQAQDVAVVIGEGASGLERLAAEELCGYIGRLYDLRVESSQEPGNAKTVFYLQAEGAHAPPEALATPLPSLSPQGILIRPFNRDGADCVLLTGGSPVAVLWAVYELAERWGVRYLVYEDVLPHDPGSLQLPESQILLEPNMRTRCWRLVNDLADGPVSWSLDENKRFLQQIAKMKYNRVFLSFWPAQPFVNYRFQGMEKPPPCFSFGEHFPINKDTVGRERFGAMTEFVNPDFLGADTPEELVKRAKNLARGILAEAQRLGMETGLAIQPFDWPKEFMEVLPGSEPVKQLGNLTAGPGKDQSMDDPLLRQLVATIVRANIETYPEAEYIHVGVPEHRGWTEQAEDAYNALDAKYGIKELGTFEELCTRARGRTSFPGGGERVETMLKGDLSSLAFFDSLIDEKNLLARPGGRPNIKLVYNGVVAELFPLVAKMVPEGGEVLSFIDYTASRQLKQRDLLRQKPPEGFPANLIFTLADDNVGVLPQLATGSLHEIMGELRASGWSGFYTRYWTVGDLVPTIHYLAKASWDASVTPESAYRDLVEHIAGPDSVTPALEALATIEAITKGLDQHGLGFGFPVPSMMTKHYNAGGLSDDLKADHAHYREALANLRAARENSAAPGYKFLDYMVGRLVFAVRYLDAAEAFGATSRAGKAGNTQEAREHIEEAYTAIREALQTWADIAEDHGDLGAVALMNKYCYRPIRDLRSELQKDTAEPEIDRKMLSHRKRRIIFNDDGDDVWHPDASTPEGFVGVRLKHMLDTQADTLFYCTTQSFNYFTHKTEIGEVFVKREGPFANNNMQALLDQGTDPLKLAIEFAHKHHIEAIWTLRMNDIHDAFTPALWPQWKTDHPDALLGKREDWGANPPGSQARWWAGVDFNREDVRARTIELIEEVARNYNVDGIDLDWLRHPVHFPETVQGKPATQQSIDLLTGLVRDIRTMIGRVEKERGRPILLATRVPLTVAQGLYIGTDIQTWLKEGLVDIVTTGGGYVPFSMPTAEVATICHQYDVPVYPCISASGMMRRAPFGKGQLYGIEGWRATAANAFAQGADGISLFNLFPSPGDETHNEMVRQAFSELGDPATLAGKDRLFVLDNEAHMATHGYVNHIVPHAQCLPKLLEPGKTTTASLPVSDVPPPVKGAIALRVQLEAEVPVMVKFNGTPVALKRVPELEERFGMVWMTGPVSAEALAKGGNEVAVTPADSAKPTRWTGLELLVQYSGTL